MSQNYQQKITIFTGFLGDATGIVISNLMILFIPINYMFNNINFTTQDRQITVILTINIFSVFCFFILYLIEISREIWLVNHFDYSKRYNSLHLAVYKDRYPDLFLMLSTHNTRYYFGYSIVKYITLLNFIVSTFIIIKYYYNDYKTITTLFTNFWICWSKIRKGINIANDSLNNGIGYSYYNTQNLSFNRIDSNFKRHISNSNNNMSRSNSVPEIHITDAEINI